MKVQFKVNGETVVINASMETLNEIQGMALNAGLYAEGVQIKHPNEKAADYYNQWFDGLFDALDDYYNNN